MPIGETLVELGPIMIKKLKLIANNNEKNDMKNIGNVIDIENNEMNLNTISKRKCCDSDKTDDVLFAYPFN